MSTSELGYGLLFSLLIGAPVDVGIGGHVEPHPAAHLLVIGYGAGGTPGRLGYRFERKIDQARAVGHPNGDPKWCALVYDPSSTSAASAQWYSERGFEVMAYGDGDLGRVAQDTVARIANR